MFGHAKAWQKRRYGTVVEESIASRGKQPLQESARKLRALYSYIRIFQAKSKQHFDYGFHTDNYLIGGSRYASNQVIKIKRSIDADARSKFRKAIPFPHNRSKLPTCSLGPDQIQPNNTIPL